MEGAHVVNAFHRVVGTRGSVHCIEKADVFRTACKPRAHHYTFLHDTRYDRSYRGSLYVIVHVHIRVQQHRLSLDGQFYATSHSPI